MPKPKSRKRGKPKSSRAGCLMCKSHKHQANGDSEAFKTATQKRQDASEKEQIRDA